MKYKQYKNILKKRSDNKLSDKAIKKIYKSGELIGEVIKKIDAFKKKQDDNKTTDTKEV